MSRFGYRSMVHAVALVVTFSPKTTAIVGRRQDLHAAIRPEWLPTQVKELIRELKPGGPPNPPLLIQVSWRQPVCLAIRARMRVTSCSSS